MTTPLVVYIWPQVGEAIHDKQAQRFIASYEFYKPKISHELLIVFNTPNNELKIVPTTCSECAVHCGSLVHVRDGTIEAIKPYPDHPLSKGAFCIKGLKGPTGLTFHEKRLLHRGTILPAIRPPRPSLQARRDQPARPRGSCPEGGHLR